MGKLPNFDVAKQMKWNKEMGYWPSKCPTIYEIKEFQYVNLRKISNMKFLKSVCSGNIFLNLSLCC